MLVSQSIRHSGIGKDGFTGSGLVSGLNVLAGVVDRVTPVGVAWVESMFTVKGLR